MSAAPARPAPGTPRAYHFPRFTRHALPNGVRVIVAPVRDLPLVTLRAVVDAGATHDPAGQAGVAALANALLAEGTTSLDGPALADRFERLGTTLEVGSDWDQAWVEVSGVASRLGAFAELVADVLAAPAFAERDVARVRAERLAELLEQQAEPRGLADDHFARFAYAPGARFGTPMGGSEATVTGVDRAAVAAFHAARYAPATTTVLVVGDVGADDAVAIVARAFGGWQGSARTTAAPGAPDARVAGARTVEVVHKPDAPQSEIRVGHVAIPRGDARWIATSVMNAILGGLFSSRINLNLRERHAYTYGAFSSVDPRRHAGLFEVATAVQSDVTDKALAEILAELDAMVAAPPTADELALATAYLAGVFPIRYETTAQVAEALARLVTFGLPDAYYDTYREAVLALTPADIHAAARGVLDPAGARIVVVGDAAAIASPLAALGPVRRWDATGAPLE